VSLDNLVLDGFSMMNLFAELDRTYRELCRGEATALPPPQVTFRDYVTQTQPDAESLAIAEKYWLDRLADLPPGPQLPLATDPMTVAVPRFVRREARLGPEQWQRLKSKARGHGITPSAVLLSCYAEVLGACSDQRDLTLTLTLFDRRQAHPDIDQVLGDFTSLLLVAYQPAAEEGWLDSARRLQQQLWQDLDHRDAPGVWVLRQLARQTTTPGTAIPVVFTSVIGLAGDVADSLPWPDWSISQTPQVWLDHQAIEREGGVILTWDAVEELFPTGLLDEAFAAYRSMLDWLSVAEWTDPAPLHAAPSHSRPLLDPSNVPHDPNQRRDVAEPSEQDQPPDGVLELSLARIWADLLGASPPSRRTNFFAAGGDSLLATRLAQAVQRSFGVELSLREFFSDPTIAGIAAALAPRLESPTRPAAINTETETMEDGSL
jgi:non-ribosomal peptide synthetase component F